MGAEYKLIAYAPDGTRIAEVTDYLQVAYAKRVNDIGRATFQLNGAHWLVSQLQPRSIVEVWRRNAQMGVDWYADYSGLYLAQRQKQPSVTKVFTATCLSSLVKLKWRYVLWKASTSNRNKFFNQYAESIMKLLVDYNAGSNATVANGRVRNGTISGVGIESDGAGGNQLPEYSCAWLNLLAALQEVAAIGGGDFDLVRTGDADYEFRFYAGQLGTDRRSSVRFALNLGNMENPEYVEDRTEEETVVVVGGQDEKEARLVVVRTSGDYSTDNDVEGFYNGSHLETEDGLASAGDNYLSERKRLVSFSFDALQTEATYYGKHYFLGDLVRGRFDEIAGDFKIDGIDVSVSPKQDEKITPQLSRI